MQYDRKTLIDALRWEKEQRNAKFELEAQECEVKADQIRRRGHDFTHNELKVALYDLLGQIEEFPGKIVYSEDLDRIFFRKDSYNSHKAVSEKDIEVQEKMAEKKRSFKSTEDSALLRFLESISHTKVSQSALEKAGFNIKAGRLIGDYLGREAE